MNFWNSRVNIYDKLSPIAPDILAAHASQAYLNACHKDYFPSVCVQSYAQSGWLHAETTGAAVESWQTGFNLFAYRSARSILYWADECSTRCDLFSLVPRCLVSRCPPLRYDVALSGLAISAPPQNNQVIANASLFETERKVLANTGNNASVWTFEL